MQRRSNGKGSRLGVKIFLALLAAWLVGPANAQIPAPTVVTGAPPAWVDEPAPYASTVAQPDEDVYGEVLMLFENQMNALTGELFVHVIKKITSESGAQQGATLSFPYDPSYQKLTVHQVVIRRDGQTLERLDPGRFKVIQQETDLDRQVYNGTLSAILFLDDVRVGDQVEYSFTVTGRNPALHGRLSEMFLAQWPFPIQQLRQRLLWPADRPLQFKTIGGGVDPQITELGGTRIYVWDRKNLPAITLEDGVPSTYMAYPFIQVTSFQSWAEVATWGAALFADPHSDDTPIKLCSARLRQPGQTDAETVQAALDFVQNQIRYLGIEFGPNSYHPSDPVAVLNRRFGDCKDKAALLCALLQDLGYDAAPVLVGTGYRDALKNFLPAANIFNHALVRVIVNGQAFWLDPTDKFQRGPLYQRYLQDYGYGLVLQPGETGLTPLPAANKPSTQTYTSEIFQVGGQKAPTRLTVKSTYYGLDAEWMRLVLAATGRNALAKSYLNDYAGRYPGISSSAPMLVDDATNVNLLTITHQYLITNFWVLTGDKLRYECQFYPLGIHAWLIKPKTLDRTMPLDISFPRQRTVHTEINLPVDFKLTGGTHLIEGPGGKLRMQRDYIPKKVTLDFRYDALTNVVYPARMPDYLKSLNDMEQVMGYSLYWRDQAHTVGNGVNWPVLFMATLYTIALAAVLLVVYRRPSQPPPVTDPADAALCGLRGWLFLVGINLLVGPVRLLLVIHQNLPTFSVYSWQQLTTPGSQNYNSLWSPLLCFELLGQLTILLLAIFSLVLFFQKRRLFPKSFILLIALNAIFVVCDHAFATAIVKHPAPTAAAEHARNLLQVMFGCFIWIPYMLRSRRVKATFTR
jgi:transglutaminase-like putative cysteine protease